ncbi:HlyD family secretion protein [Campylobacter canadensis]|uniref:HlyD family secretion protein n=1 Tax=Campylobacter canadensis TaxID=449520 RepID=A0ABS7WTD4_9BACT|nr:HlyD family secretion protein [Campylobacter canadensis]MBZ7988038.1 HlyD family secretion protein [Campylobacter canadensis]MBZ7995471.1 HlyD family secretion protein [Campylobacter canadensis]MBZ7997277.1 HlyD family secretion protein [Campylobacter canadensis]MBZ7999006.1 HlyD family secretion protein [Campylobacter canadensis]MBZ8000805.1 HlyD family secretion protein [Campylobacter canadensis]
MKKYNLLVILVLVAFIALSIIFVLFSFDVLEVKKISTQNAYVKSNSVDIYSALNEKIVKINVKDFQKVKKDELLFVLDCSDYLEKQNIAEAKMNIKNESLNKIAQDKKSMQIQIQEKEINYKVQQSVFNNVKNEYERESNLFIKGAISKQQFDNQELLYEKAKLSLEQAKLALEQSKIDFESFILSENIAKQEFLSARAEFEISKNLSSKCEIKAPFDGTLGEINLSIGDYANKKFSRIISDEKYIIANIKETNISNLKVGQEVSFSVDSLKGLHFSGVIADIAPATGSAFSDTKIDNSIGNFIKITQRIPVKINITSKDTTLLKSGMSVNVKANKS